MSSEMAIPLGSAIHPPAGFEQESDTPGESNDPDLVGRRLQAPGKPERYSGRSAAVWLTWAVQVAGLHALLHAVPSCLGKHQVWLTKIN